MAASGKRRIKKMQKADFSNWGDPNAEAIKKDPIGRPAAPSFSGRQGGVFSFVAFAAFVRDFLVVLVIAFSAAFGCPCTAIRQRRRDDGGKQDWAGGNLGKDWWMWAGRRDRCENYLFTI